METPTLNRVFENMSGGVIVLNQNGNVEFANAASYQILNIKPNTLIASNFADILINNSNNDPFLELLINAIYNKGKVLEGIVSYNSNFVQDMPEKFIEVRTSYTKSNNSEMVILLNDVTKREIAYRNSRDSSKIFAFLFSIVAIYVFAFGIVNAFSFAKIDMRLFSKITEVVALLISFILLKNISGSLANSGMKRANIKTGIIKGLIISLVIISVLMVLKYLVILIVPNIFPANAPFFKFDRYILGGISIAHLIYPISVMIQEFLARIVTQDSIKRVFSIYGEKKASFYSIFFSSLLFSVIHLHRGLNLMVGAFFISIILGMLYRKTNNYWLVVVVHLLVGDIGISLLP